LYFSIMPFIKRMLEDPTKKYALEFFLQYYSDSSYSPIIMAQALLFCSDLFRADSILNYFSYKDGKKYCVYRSNYSYNDTNIKDLAESINKIDNKYARYFNPFEKNIDSFKEHCKFIESMQDNLNPELVVKLAHELTLMEYQDGNILQDLEILQDLIKECLSKNSDDNHALLLKMLNKKRESEVFHSPELMLKAYRDDLTFEQYEDQLLQYGYTYKKPTLLTYDKVDAFLFKKLCDLVDDLPK
jgi:hypothetical protein